MPAGTTWGRRPKRSIAARQADPRFAYGYYNAGLTYDRINRPDLAIARLEMFVRLAPGAPERPEVTSILQTVRGR
jgi:hypothetical protein